LPLNFSKISIEFHSSFEFLDEHHVLYADSLEDSIYVYDLRCGTEPARKGEGGHRGFRLDLPPIHRATTSRYIQIQRNALPVRMQKQAQHELHLGNNDDGSAPTSPPPFHADPRARLIVLRIVTSPVEFGEEQFELHVPARALLEHYAANMDAGGNAVLPWSAWRADTGLTPARKLPFLPQARMITYGMRVVSHPPDWDEGVLYVDSYPPRRASAVREGSGTTRVGTRQGIPLPDESPEKTNFLSVLCEDGLLCYEVMSLPLNTERRID
jgi:hypothetical protein